MKEAQEGAYSFPTRATTSPLSRVYTPDSEGISRLGGHRVREPYSVPQHVEEENVPRRDARDFIEKNVFEVHLVEES